MPPAPSASAPRRLPALCYAVVCTLLPVGGLAWAWAAGAVNVPKWDDHALKAFILALEQETSLPGALGQFVRQHNEHRIAYDRLITWLDYRLFGKFSYQRLMAYGDLSLLALVALFGRYLARYVRWWYLFLPPIAFFLLSLANWENLYWALSALQNFGIVVWSLWALYALSHRPSPWLAIGLAAVATLVSGNGFLVWPIGATVLLTQRRFRLLLPWLGAATLLILLYFVDYTQPTVAPPGRGSLPELLVGGLAFLGAAADALPVSQPYWLSAGLGALLLGGWTWAFIRAFPPLLRRRAWSARQGFAFGALAFIVVTAAVVVWSRYGFGQATLLTSRYRIYSLTLLTLSYTYWLSDAGVKKAWPLALAGLVVSGLLWWSAFVVNANESINLRQYLLSAQYNWTYRGPRPVPMIDAATRRLIDNAPAFYDAALPAYFAPATGPAFPVDSLYKTSSQYLIRLGATGVQQAGTPSLRQPDRGAWLLLQSNQRTYLFPVPLIPQRNWRVLTGQLPRYATAYPVDVPIATTDVNPGTYTLAIVQVAPDGTSQVRPTGRLLTVAPHTDAAQTAKNW